MAALYFLLPPFIVTGDHTAVSTAGRMAGGSQQDAGDSDDRALQYINATQQASSPTQLAFQPQIPPGPICQSGVKIRLPHSGTNIQFSTKRTPWFTNDAYTGSIILMVPVKVEWPVQSAHQPVIALLLTGGGARAAYQVGVLLAIAQLYQRRDHIPFKILCGSSAGAVNATALACDSACFHLGVKRLDSVWRHFTTGQVYRSDWRGITGHLLGQFTSRFRADYGYQRPVSLFDNHPLHELLTKLIDFRRIDRNISRGLLRAVAVTASSYSNGHSISFFQGAAHLQPWHRARREGQRALLSTSHLLASSAIPFVFPSVRIHQHYYGDGSINQLAPLSPAIHLGAERLVIVGVEQPSAQPLAGLSHHPSSAAIAGHLLDTIFADTLRSDLERLERINRTLRHLPDGVAMSGELRPIEALLINPSQSFSQIAQRHYRALPRGLRSLLKTVGVREESESSLLSYLLFERGYTQELIQLGFEDAKRRQRDIASFLSAPL